MKKTVLTILVFLSFTAWADSWHYEPWREKGKDHLIQCVSPSGNRVGGYISCYLIKACGNAAAISNYCYRTYGKRTSPTPRPISKDFIVIKTKIDNVRLPKGPADILVECVRNKKCQAVLSAAASYMGIPPKYIKVGNAIIGTTRKSKNSGGTYMDIGLPYGYSYCRSLIHTVSIVPNDGPRGSMLIARADSKKLYVETWTPIRGFGQGRSWAEITVIGVRTDKASSYYRSRKCFQPKSRILMACRGCGCERPRDTSDEGQSVRLTGHLGACSREH